MKSNKADLKFEEWITIKELARKIFDSNLIPPDHFLLKAFQKEEKDKNDIKPDLGLVYPTYQLEIPFSALTDDFFEGLLELVFNNNLQNHISMTMKESEVNRLTTPSCRLRSGRRPS